MKSDTKPIGVGASSARRLIPIGTAGGSVKISRKATNPADLVAMAPHFFGFLARVSGEEACKATLWF